MKKIVLILICSFWACCLRSQSTCDKSCSCDKIMTPAGLQFSHLHNKNEWMFSYRNMFMDMRGLLSGTKNINEESLGSSYLMSPSGMWMDMHMLMGMGGITDKLTVMGMVNYYDKFMSMKMLGQAMHHHTAENISSSQNISSSGLGDSKIYLMYGLVKTADHQLIAGAGLNLPTGKINCCGMENTMYEGGRLPYNMQAGCGTWAFLPTFAYLARNEKMNYGLQVSAILHNGMSRYGYRWGNSAKLEPWLSWCPYDRVSLTGRIEFNFEQTICGHDDAFYFYSEPASNTQNYGGKRFFGWFGGMFKLNKAGSLRAGLEYGVPFYQNVNGIQMRIRQSLNSSISFFF